MENETLIRKRKNISEIQAVNIKFLISVKGRTRLDKIRMKTWG